VNFFYDVSLLTLLIVVALAVLLTRDLFAVAMLFSIYSLLSAALFTTLDAPDVAMTEAAVGAGISTVLMLVTLSIVGRKEEPRPKRPLLALAVVTVTGAVLAYGMFDLPLHGDPNAPAHGDVARYYLQRGPVETGIPNVVTSVLASYRGYDTLGETGVVFIAGIAVLALLGVLPRKTAHRTGRATGTPRHLVLRVVSKILLPLILMFALYVQAHGEYSPGGGFQAGVIFATGFVLFAIVFGVTRARQAAPQAWIESGMALGLLLYLGVGIAGILRSGSFLDYGALAADPVAGQHSGILLVEIGVGLTVASVMMSIFFTFADLEPS
jgi:multicomponent Na+:H+ antiporter subunit B